MRSRFRLAYVAAAVLVLAAAIIASTSVASPSRDAVVAGAARPALTGMPAAPPCASLTTLSRPNTTINSAVDTPAGTIPPVPRTCRVHATVNTPGVTDQIGIDVWMPVEGVERPLPGCRRGRLQQREPELARRPGRRRILGWLHGRGHTGASSFTGSFALDSAGRLDWPLIQDFSYRALHDLAVVGKGVTAAFYGKRAKYSYWTGCSTVDARASRRRSGTRPTTTASSRRRRRSTGRSSSPPSSGPSS